MAADNTTDDMDQLFDANLDSDETTTTTTKTNANNYSNGNNNNKNDDDDNTNTAAAAAITRPSALSTSHLKNMEVRDMDVESADEAEEEETTLRLTGQNLSEIPADIAQSKGETIRILVLTNNKLKSLANLQYFKRLETLQLDRNDIVDIEDMPKMPYLHTLWLNNNKLADMQKLLRILAKNCPRLSYLSLLRNPMCPSVYFQHGNEDKYRRYRYTVLYHLHGLTHLDTTEVSPQERKDAMEKGKFLVVKKPSQQQMEGTEEAQEAEEQEAVEIKPKTEPAAFLGKGKIKYDGRDSEGNRFIFNSDL